jgi:hypothetical protein
VLFIEVQTPSTTPLIQVQVLLQAVFIAAKPLSILTQNSFKVFAVKVVIQSQNQETTNLIEVHIFEKYNLIAASQI